VPVTRRPSPEQQPPRGVPRWLWPPPGATVREVAIVESVDGGGSVAYAVPAGEAPAGTPFEGAVRLGIARTEMDQGRVGHAYALNGGPLGAPGEDGSRGVLWRFIHATLRA
jgi:hypothetical protein